MGVVHGNHYYIHLKWVSFSSGYLYKLGQLPFFYLFWTTNLKYTVSCKQTKRSNKHNRLTNKQTDNHEILNCFVTSMKDFRTYTLDTPQ